MLNLISLFILLYTGISYAEISESICDLPDHANGSAKLNELSDDAIKAACAEYELYNKCKEVIKSPQEFNAIMLAENLIKKDKIEKKLIPSLAAMVMAENNSLSQKNIEDKVKAKIVQFVNENKCKPTFGKPNINLGYDDLGGKENFNNDTEKQNGNTKLMRLSKDPAALQRFKGRQLEINQEKFYNFISDKGNTNSKGRHYNTYFCSSKVGLRQPAKTVFHNPKCIHSVSKYFVDNKAVLKNESEDSRRKDQEQINKCIADNKLAGYTATKVTIISSANQLKNTSTLQEIKNGEGFCGFDFQGLSAARNEFALKKILPGIEVDALIPINTNADGDNGNGTSGPCPYGQNGRLLSEYAGSNKKKLEDYKKTEIVIDFKPGKELALKQSKDKSGTVSLASPCVGLEIKCAN